MSKNIIGTEWAALRIAHGAHPIICPLRRSGLWLYIERTETDQYEIRVVEPMGTRRTQPVIAKESIIDNLLVNATNRPLKTP